LSPFIKVKTWDVASFAPFSATLIYPQKNLTEPGVTHRGSASREIEVPARKRAGTTKIGSTSLDAL
jgi:hypothetical protein